MKKNNLVSRRSIEKHMVITRSEESGLVKGRLRIRTERAGRFNIRTVMAVMKIDDIKSEESVRRELAGSIAELLRTKRKSYTRIKPMRTVNKTLTHMRGTKHDSTLGNKKVSRQRTR
jgi:hypothetical protein